MKRIIGLCVALMSSSLLAEDTAQYLQDISVTVKANGGTGSGVIVTRKIKNDKNEEINANFILTAAHVIDSNRTTRKILDSEGREKSVVEFSDAKIVKELIEGGRKVGELTMDAKVIKYSDADEGQDIAVLMIRKQGFVDCTARFYLKEEIPSIGTQLFHV